MKKAINVFIAATLIFLLLIGLSGVSGPVLSHVVYAAACIVPTLFAIFSKWGDACVERARYLTLDGGRVLKFLPTVAPVIAATVGISTLTSLLMGTVGLSNTKTPEELGGSLAVALLLHALMPAVLEELLFRYVPLRLIARRSPRCAVILSALFFALIHTDVFAFPYAFFAGLAFMVLDIALDSIYPSIILHFINNALSVALVFLGADPTASMAIYATIVALTVISAVIIFIFRRRYAELIMRAFDKGEGYKRSNEVLLVIVPCLVLAAIRLVAAFLN